MAALGWAAVNNASSALQVISVAGRTAGFCIAGIHVWTYRNGIEIVCQPLSPVKDRLDDADNMLKSLTDEDKRRIEASCASSGQSVANLQDVHKRLRETYDVIKYERTQESRLKLHMQNITSWLCFWENSELSDLKRKADRLYKDVLATTTENARAEKKRLQEMEMEGGGGASNRTPWRPGHALPDDPEAQNADSSPPEPRLLRAFFSFDDPHSPASDDVNADLPGVWAGP